MELRHLRYLVAVVEEGTVTAAAERLHVAQPGVSAQLRQLEREIGEPLLARSSRGMAVTEAGAAVLPFARAALAAVEGARLAVDELKGLVRGQVRVGMAPSLAATDLPELLAEFRAAHPAVEVSLREGTSAELLAGLVDGMVDLVWAGIAEEPPEGVAYRVVTEQALVAVGWPPVGAGLGGVGSGGVGSGGVGGPRSGSVTVAELVGAPLMCMAEGSGPRAAFDAACVRAGVQPRIAFEAGDPLLLARLAARGLGVAVLPEGAVRAAGVELDPVGITPETTSRIVLAWRGSGPTSPAARAVIALARRS
ncbi:LysR family transcriptional regulator [Pseudonocardia xishanensis]|uniref:LysR substrate-binding domain-containing protein n=1 Tax=Pseudonocardia xishanensis TaxID=630995 RepID=A0ABP8RGI8_9PSEU